MASFHIEREEADDRGRLVALVDGHEAELTWKRSRQDGRLLIVAKHTGVPIALGGKGVGKALVERLVARAREEGALIVPSCSFVRALMDRRPDWQDVRAPDET